MLNVVVCDSGISEFQNNYCQPVDIGHGVYDDNGHGTMVIETIHKIVKQKARLFSMKILDFRKRTTLDVLIEALWICLEQKYDVICLPLSVVNCTDNLELMQATQALSLNNSIIISALANNVSRSIPAAFKSVIGTCFKEDDNSDPSRKFFYARKDIQVELPKRTVIFNTGSSYGMLGGNSLSCALFTTHVIDRMHGYEHRNNVEIYKEFELEGIQCLSYAKFFSDNYSGVIDRRMFEQAKAKIEEANSLFRVNNMHPIYESFPSLEDFSSYIDFLTDAGYIINKRTILSLSDCTSIDSFATYLCQQLSGKDYG